MLWALNILHWPAKQLLYLELLHVSWSILSFSWSVSILCSNLKLSAECLTCWAWHLKSLTSFSFCLFPPAVFSSPRLLFPSSFTLLFSCVLHNPLPNLCFRPLWLAPGKASKPSFSVFCCKYSHSRRFSPSCTLARTRYWLHWDQST